MKDINEYLDAKSVIIFVLAVLIVFVTVLSFQQVQSLSDLSAMAETESLKNMSYQNEIKALQRQKEESKNNTPKFEGYLRMPQTPDEAGLIAGVDALCKVTSCVLSDITFLQRTELNGYLEMPFTMNLISDYYSLVRFLEGISTSERFIQLTGIEITVNEEWNLLNVTIAASAYSYTQ